MPGATPAICPNPNVQGAPKSISATDTSLLSEIGSSAGATCTFTNGVELGPTCQPYASTSLWNRKLSNIVNPTLVANSAAIISTAESTSNHSPASLHYFEFGSPSEVAHPIYYTTGGVNDVQVNVSCSLYCSGWTANTNGPASLGAPGTIWVPKKARPAAGSDTSFHTYDFDRHMAVVQPNGDEIDFWGTLQNGAIVTRDWQSGDGISGRTVQNVGKYAAGVGQMGSSLGYANYAQTAGGAALAAGIIRESELAARKIPHALFLVTNCVGSGFVFPGIQGGDNVCTGSNPLLFGHHIWMSMTDTAIDALAVDVDVKTVMHALHQYGGYIMDSGGSGAVNTDGVGVMLESGTQFGAFGQTNPFDTYTASDPNWVTDGNVAPPQGRALSDTSGLTWSSWLQVVDPCYAQNSC